MLLAICNEAPCLRALTKDLSNGQVCIGFSQSHMVLPVPLHISPSFTTDICHLQYNLHFEFVTRSVASWSTWSAVMPEPDLKKNL